LPLVTSPHARTPTTRRQAATDNKPPYRSFADQRMEALEVEKTQRDYNDRIGLQAIVPKMKMKLSTRLRLNAALVLNPADSKLETSQTVHRGTNQGQAKLTISVLRRLVPVKHSLYGP
jgi:hypothetical protein